MTTSTYVSGLLFTKAHKLVRGKIYELLEQYDLNPTTWSILGAVMQAEDGVRSSTVAASLGVKPPLVTMLTDHLIEHGLVRRLPHHTDGRAKLLVITPEGKKMAIKVEAMLNEAIMELLHGLSPSEIVTFQKTLETIIKNAQ